MKSLLALSLFAACSSANADKPAPTPPRNLVCERVALLNAKADCKPEFTDEGDMHVHTARVTVEKTTLVCGLSVGQLAMACGGMEVQQPKATESTGDAAPPSAPVKKK